MPIHFYSPENVPEAVLSFWRTEGVRQDQIGYFTRSYEWFSMMASDTRRHAIVVVIEDDKGSCLGIMPLFSCSQSLGAGRGRKGFYRRLNGLRMCGGDYIGPDMSVPLLTELITAIFGKYPDIDVLNMDHVISGARSDGIIKACAQNAQFFAYQSRAQMPHYRLVFPEDREKMSFRSAKSISRMLGKEHALAKHVGAECKVIEIRDRNTCSKYGEAITSLIRETWQAEQLGHIFSVDEANEVADRGWLRSFLLLAGDQAAAFTLCYQGMGTLMYERIGYSPKFARHSPGILLLYKILERLWMDDEVRFVDFGVGEAVYKQKAANDTIYIDAILVIRNCVSLRLLVAFARISNSVIRTGKRILGLSERFMGKIRKLRVKNSRG
ncbi:MAG: GNAT family N-acetyltransferase [Lentisphaerae bacterium]|nr:GNAT family N-acetyltransferase [Lentisphaerota bacterium]